MYVYYNTPPIGPVAIPNSLQFSKDDINGVISLDWTTAFRYNGQFVTSCVERNGILLVQRPITSFNITNEPRGISKLHVPSTIKSPVFLL